MIKNLYYVMIKNTNLIYFNHKLNNFHEIYIYTLNRLVAVCMHYLVKKLLSETSTGSPFLIAFKFLY